MLGLYNQFTPKFVKKYADLNQVIEEALVAYREDVINGRFPESEHTYPMKSEEEEAFLHTFNGNH
jgi:3-methyl-2-oxobutanoate hydroxymethyltransferase